MLNYPFKHYFERIKLTKYGMFFFLFFFNSPPPPKKQFEKNQMPKRTTANVFL